MFAGCSSKNEIPQANKDVVELRYRVESEYQLPARDAAPFTIVVKSSRPWSIASQHPDWCIIGQEEGEAVDGALVHEGKGESTSVKVQYYDNTDLDDRIDKIEIASDYLVAKTVTVYQRGIAYLNVPEADIEGGLFVEKPQGSVTINIKANQKWSTKILPYEGGTTDWLSISEGETGELDGTVTVAVKENTGEKRYAFVGVYDRHDEERAMIKITQDGVQLDPEAFEIRLGYDQVAATLHVVSNSAWVVEKQGEEAILYSIYQKEAEKTEETEDTEKAEDPGYGCLRNGEEISYDMFSAAWDRLLTVTVSGKLPNGYVPGEPHTRYTIHSVSGAVHTVELSELDAMHDAVTLDGYTLFYLIKGGMTDLP